MRSKLAAALAVLIAVAACTTPPERLALDGRTIVVLNDSGDAWNNVEIWVNTHYRVTRETIAPGERFSAPLEGFVAGFGQRFPANQQVTGIEVTATDASGNPVKVVWGTERQR